MIYLDYNATTPVDPRVLAEMLPLFREEFANPASAQHASGRRAAARVDAARAQVAEAVGASPREVIFTSGATEALNLAIRGLAEGGHRGRSRVLVGATEHKAVLDTAAALSSATVEVIPVTPTGQVDRDALADLLSDDVLLVCVMYANNETGTINPVAEVADAVHSAGALLLCDATQAVGKIEVALGGWGADALTLSAHKAYGPKGVGALVANREYQRRLAPLVRGGGHERGLRSGTLNTPGIVGLGAAISLAAESVAETSPRVRTLRDRLHSALTDRLPGVSLNGDPSARLPNTVNLRFESADAEAVMANAPELAASSGSACQSLVPAPSHVLVAMGLDLTAASESIRFSLGSPTTEDDVDSAAEMVVNAVERVRALSKD